MNEPLPPVRALDVLSIEEDGQDLFLLRDGEGYANAPLTVSPNVLYILQFFDGQTPHEKLQSQYQNTFGEQLFSDDIEKLIEILDKNYFLLTERFLSHKTKVDQEFIDAPARPFVCFGGESKQREQIRTLLDESVTAAGYQPGFAGEKKGENIAGIVAPHIDYMRGGKVYGSAYGELFGRFSGDTLIVLGTNHMFCESLVALTDKDFETPFGTVKTDKNLVGEIAEQLPGDPFASQSCHKNEHSIELAATMIAYANRHNRIRIVPILIGGFPLFDDEKPPSAPLDHPEVAPLIAAIRKIVEARPGQVAVVASADFAHIGKHFQDEFFLSDERLSGSKKRDLESIEPLLQGRAADFVEYIAGEKDARRICGLAPISVALACLAPASGRLLDYAQWIDPERTASVSFAALAWNKR